MRGGYLHNKVLVEPVAGVLRELGMDVHTEYPIKIGHHVSYADIFASCDGLRLVCEAERSPQRVANDVRKAMALDAQLLIIVVPNKNIARSVFRRLKQIDQPLVGRQPLEIRVLALGPAVRMIRNFGLFRTVTNVR